MKTSERKEQAIRYLRDPDEGIKIRQKHVAYAIGVSQQRAAKLLAMLVEEGTVQRSRERGYHLV